MDLVNLRYFRRIARLGSMTAAAEELGVRQPSLSCAVRKLEDDLGTSLFMRHRGGVSLTEAGSELLRHAEEILAALDRASVAVSELDGELVGSFVLGCHESLGAYFLPHVLPTVLAGAPDIELTLDTASSPVVLSAVIDRRIDFGLVVNPAPHPDLVMLPLFDDAIDFFVDDSRPRTCTRETALDLVRRSTVLLAGRVPQCTALLLDLARQGVQPRRTLDCGDFELVARLTATGLGVGVLPRRIARASVAGLCRLHAGLPCFADRIMLVYRGDRPKTRAATWLKDTIVGCGREMPPP